MGSDSHRIEFDAAARISASVPGATARKMQPIHLTLDAALRASASVRIAVTFATTAAVLSGSSYVSTFVLFHGIYLPDSGRSQQSTPLPRGNGLKQKKKKKIQSYWVIFKASEDPTLRRSLILRLF